VRKRTGERRGLHSTSCVIRCVLACCAVRCVWCVNPKRKSEKKRRHTCGSVFQIHIKCGLPPFWPIFSIFQVGGERSGIYERWSEFRANLLPHPWLNAVAKPLPIYTLGTFLSLSLLLTGLIIWKIKTNTVFFYCTIK
jgi:hypothetical protein